MSFDLTSALTVQERNDGLMEVPQFDLSSAVPVETPPKPKNWELLKDPSFQADWELTAKDISKQIQDIINVPAHIYNSLIPQPTDPNKPRNEGIPVQPFTSDLFTDTFPKLYQAITAPGGLKSLFTGEEPSGNFGDISILEGLLVAWGTGQAIKSYNGAIDFNMKLEETAQIAAKNAEMKTVIESAEQAVAQNIAQDLSRYEKMFLGKESGGFPKGTTPEMKVKIIMENMKNNPTLHSEILIDTGLRMRGVNPNSVVETTGMYVEDSPNLFGKLKLINDMIGEAGSIPIKRAKVGQSVVFEGRPGEIVGLDGKLASIKLLGDSANVIAPLSQLNIAPEVKPEPLTIKDFNQEKAPLAESEIKMNPEVVKKANEMQNILGKRLVISSGYRTDEYNQDLIKRGYKADPNSVHKGGNAFDVDFKKSGLTQQEVVDAALKVGLNIEDLTLTKSHVHAELPTEGSPTKLYQPTGEGQKPPVEPPKTAVSGAPEEPRLGKFNLMEGNTGKGGILNTKDQVDFTTRREITSKMPFTLLGNKAEVLSRLSEGLKNELRKGIKKVHDLWGGAKGYRIGLFPDIPSKDYALNEFSNERSNYYKNVQNPEAHKVMIQEITRLKEGIVNELSKALDIDPTKYATENLIKAINKELSSGSLQKAKYQYIRESIQNYGNKILVEAQKDNFQSPESSAKYYFLENTALFGVKKDATGYSWNQGILRTSAGKSQLKEMITRLDKAPEIISEEHSRDKEMSISQGDAWKEMDKLTENIKSGKVNPDETVVLADPQYLNPSGEEGTYSVGQSDTTWEGHKKNLEEHLLPLVKTGAKVIYTNNLDANLAQWLQDNNIPFNIEAGVGAVANRGGREEVIAFINYKFPEQFTSGAGADYVPTSNAGELFGESTSFKKWLEDHKDDIQTKVSASARFTPEERKAIVEEATKKGLIYTDFKGKQHDRLQGLLSYYKTASATEIRDYIAGLKGEPTNPPRLYKLTGDIKQDSEAMKLINKENINYRDINKFEMNATLPVNIIEKVSGKALHDDNLLADNTFYPIEAADEAMHDRKLAENQALDKIKGKIKKGSKESAEIMKQGEKGSQLSPELAKVDKHLRERFDALFKEQNKGRALAGKPLIPYRKNYYTHMEDFNLLNEFFKGNERGMGEISNDQLDAIRKGDYTKGNMPFNRFAQQRLGNKTRYDAIGNFQAYMDVALKEIYYTPAITHARKFIEYALTKQPNAYKSLDRMLNDLKGKPSIIDQSLVGDFASSRPVKWMRSHIARSALIGNINFWAMNLSNFATSYPELGNYVNKGMLKFLGNKKWREFAFENSVMLKGRSIDPDFLDKPMHTKLEEVIGGITNMIEYNNVGSTFVGAYLKGTEELGYSKEKAIKYADSIARKTQVGYKKYEQNAWMRSNSGLLLSQFQTWTFNALNYILYDLGTANIPEDLKSLFKENKTNRTRWGKLAALIGVAITVNMIYKKLGLREPMGPNAVIPSVAGLNPGRYSDIGPVKIVKDVGTSITGKKPETRARARTRVLTSVVPGGAQIARFTQGKVFPSKQKKKTNNSF